MTDLVTLAEAKSFLRVDGTDEDGTIGILITAASDAVTDIADEWDGTGDVPARLKLAVLTRVAVAFDQRDNLRPGNGEDRLLGPYRALGV